MSGEPGLNLGSVLSADRNAKAAIQVSANALKMVSALLERVVQLEAENILIHQEINQVRTLAVMNVGSGPTTRG